MTENLHCKSYQHKELTCKDGFVQLLACWNDFKVIPYCMREELPVHFINEDGTPRFFREDE